MTPLRKCCVVNPVYVFRCVRASVLRQPTHVSATFVFYLCMQFIGAATFTVISLDSSAPVFRKGQCITYYCVNVAAQIRRLSIYIKRLPPVQRSYFCSNVECLNNRCVDQGRMICRHCRLSSTVQSNMHNVESNDEHVSRLSARAYLCRFDAVSAW